MSETAPKQKHYDADAEQRIELPVPHKNKTVKVFHILRGAADAEIIEYNKKRKVRAEYVNDQMSIKNNAVEADVWLWDKIAIGRERYQENENWREATATMHKISAINAYLTARVKPQDDESVLDEEIIVSDTDADFSIELQAFFGGELITVRHDLSSPNAAQVTEFAKLDVKPPSTSKNGTIRFLTEKIEEKAKFYDSLLVEAHGYAGRVPILHKLVVINEVFGLIEAETAKN